ncbi:MAG: alpha/beta hydrolase [Xanthomonadaceae bacterium]|nr:alpha/beta hydrolase [Xanthomonadaceae bacterium]
MIGLLLLIIQSVQAQPQWLRSDFEHPKGVFIVAHGLNTKPEKMNSLGHFLNSLGYDVYRLALPGHYGDITEMKTVTKEKWLTAALDGYQIAEARAQELKQPLYYLGFSMGSLIGETLIANHPELQLPEKIIHLAPALGIRSRSHLVKVLGIFGSEFIVNSKSPEVYKAQKGVSIAAYKALFTLENELIENKSSARINIPTLIYINEDDQLISIKGLRKFIALKKWTKSSLRPITDQKPKDELTFSHRIIDEYSLGEVAWKRITNEISAFLTDTK